MALNDIIVPKENADGDFTETVLTAGDLKLGSTSSLPVKTGSGGVLEAGAFGTSAGQFAEGNHSHSDATQSVAGFLSATDKTKLDGIAAGAEVNVNADWNATSGDAQILNKPTLGTAAASATTDFAAASHTHAASAITSGTLAHERGGLEADVSAYDGLVKISGGSTSAVTVTTAGEALLDDADAAAQRTTLGLGNSSTLDIGTTAGTVAAGDDSRFGDIPDPSSATPQALGTAAAGTSDDYSRADHVHGAPALNDLSNVSAATPSDNDVLTYDNATSTWVAEAPAGGGGSSIMQSIAVGFVIN